MVGSRGKVSYSWVYSVLLTIGTGENAFSDEVLQLGLDFLMEACSNSGTIRRIHHDGGPAQKVPLCF